MCEVVPSVKAEGRRWQYSLRLLLLAPILLIPMYYSLTISVDAFRRAEPSIDVANIVLAALYVTFFTALGSRLVGKGQFSGSVLGALRRGAAWGSLFGILLSIYPWVAQTTQILQAAHPLSPSVMMWGMVRHLGIVVLSFALLGMAICSILNLFLKRDGQPGHVR